MGEGKGERETDTGRPGHRGPCRMGCPSAAPVPGLRLNRERLRGQGGGERCPSRCSDASRPVRTPHLGQDPRAHTGGRTRLHPPLPPHACALRLPPGSVGGRPVASGSTLPPRTRHRRGLWRRARTRRSLPSRYGHGRRFPALHPALPPPGRSWPSYGPGPARDERPDPSPHFPGGWWPSHAAKSAATASDPPSRIALRTCQ